MASCALEIARERTESADRADEEWKERGAAPRGAGSGGLMLPARPPVHGLPTNGPARSDRFRPSWPLRYSEECLAC